MQEEGLFVEDVPVVDPVWAKSGMKSNADRVTAPTSEAALASTMRGYVMYPQCEGP